MSDKLREAPRGEAAWKAEKARIADRNDIAFAAGRQQREEQNAMAAEDRRAAERRDAANTPKQPGRS